MSAISRESSIARKRRSTLWRPVASGGQAGGRPPRRRAWTLLSRAVLLLAVGVGLGATVGLYVFEEHATALNVPGTARAPAEPATDGPPSDVLSNAYQLVELAEYDLAIPALTELSASTTGTTRDEASLLLARAQVAGGFRDASLLTLDDLVVRSPASSHGRAALLLRGELRIEVGDRAGAAIDFAEYADGGGGAASYALLRLGDLASDDGEVEAAISSYTAALGGSLSGFDESKVMLKLADLHESAGDLGAALDWAERVALATPSTRDRVGALERVAELQGDLGDETAREATLRTLVEQFPKYEASAEALDQLVEAGKPVSALTEAKLRSAQGETARAELLLLFVVTQGSEPDVSEAAYLLGMMREAAGDSGAAVAWFRASSPAEGASYARDRELRELQNALLLGEAEAQDSLAQFVAENGGSDFARRGALTLARVAEQNGELHAAAQLWSTAGLQSALQGDSTDSLEAYRTAAGLFSAAGDDGGTAAALEAIARNAPGSFEAIRAENELNSLGVSLESEPYYSEREPADWIRSLGLEQTSGSRTQAVSELAVAFEMSGLSDPASDLLADSGSVGRHDPHLLARLAAIAGASGDVPAAARAAGALLQRLPFELRAGIPIELGGLAYPQPYLSSAEEATARHDVDPLLLYALIRQESFFDHNAHSHADAYGLTQVIPATGAGIARELGVEPFSPEMLYRPALSLDFGAYYLAAQLEAFGGFPYAALAAYNGGPGNAERWGRDGGFDNADVYVARIDFEETSNYVRRVIENYGHYRAIYLGLARPALP
ncbi:MAG: transglycosylase SLT domain-containing protein [Dehalococcoidia bacterium]